MPNRFAQFGSALIASLIASVPFTAVSHGETPAAEECLAAPKGETPNGGHWHYRIEHPSNRHCWYVRTENGAAAQAAAAAPSTADKPAAPNTNTNTATAMPGSVANARAELTTPRLGSDQTTSASAAAGQFPAQLPATLPTLDNSPQANSTGADMLRSVVASRWPGQLAANALAPANSTDDDTADATPEPAASQPTVTATVPPAVADSTPAKPLVSTQSLIFTLVGALSVAGLVASAIGFGGRRRKRIRMAQAQTDRRANWDAARPARARPSRFPSSMPSSELPSSVPSPSTAPAAQRPNIGLPLELREADEHDDKVADMLARLARSAQV